jgi:hypothetical protein
MPSMINAVRPSDSAARRDARVYVVNLHAMLPDLAAMTEDLPPAAELVGVFADFEAARGYASFLDECLVGELRQIVRDLRFARDVEVLRGTAAEALLTELEPVPSRPSS